MKTKDENLFILYLHITLLYSINLDTMDLLLTQKSMSTSTKLLSFNEKKANHWEIVCKEYACITRTVLINSPTMQQEFLSTKVHHKLLKESKIFNACFFCMHANMMGYFFLDFILTTFFTLGHSIPSTYFKFGHFLYYKNLFIKFFFIFKSKQASTCTEITC